MLMFYKYIHNGKNWKITKNGNHVCGYILYQIKNIKYFIFISVSPSFYFIIIFLYFHTRNNF